MSSFMVLITYKFESVTDSILEDFFDKTLFFPICVMSSAQLSIVISVVHVICCLANLSNFAELVECSKPVNIVNICLDEISPAGQCKH